MKYGLALSLLTVSALWGNNVDIPLDSPLYGELERLKSLGAIEAPLPTMKPYNSVEVETLLKSIENSAYTERKKMLIQELRRFTRTGCIEASASLLLSDEESIVPNHDGTLLDDGMNADASLRLQLLNRKIGAVFTPMYRNNAQNRNDLQIGDTYVRFRWKNVNLTVGRESLWMGSGREGTLLLSNNAKPLDMIRLSSVLPFRFHPYRHEILNTIFGTMDFDLFVGRLHTHDEIVREDGTLHSGNPKFLGLQFTFRPMDLFSVGIYHTGMFGGGGRKEDFTTFWKMMFPFGQGDNTGSPNEPGDHKAGFTFEWYVSNTYQPLKVYGEWAGEDSAGGFPSRHSYIYGLLFTDTAGIEGLQTSYEHLKMDPDHRDYWYHHYPIYHDGYTNDGIIMGHYNGANGSRDTLRVTYLKDLRSDYTLAWEHFDDHGITEDYLRFGARHRLDDHKELSLSGWAGKTAWLGVSFKWIF